MIRVQAPSPHVMAYPVPPPVGVGVGHGPPWATLNQKHAWQHNAHDSKVQYVNHCVAYRKRNHYLDIWTSNWTGSRIITTPHDRIGQRQPVESRRNTSITSPRLHNFFLACTHITALRHRDSACWNCHIICTAHDMRHGIGLARSEKALIAKSFALNSIKTPDPFGAGGYCSSRSGWEKNCADCTTSIRRLHTTEISVYHFF